MLNRLRPAFLSWGIGSLIWAGVVFFIVLSLPSNSSIGHIVLSRGKSIAAIQSGGICAKNNAPAFSSELKNYTNPAEHPIVVDLGSRYQSMQQTFKIVDVIQYRGCVMIDTQASDQNYYLAVYEWDGEHWSSLSFACYTC